MNPRHHTTNSSSRSSRSAARRRLGRSLAAIGLALPLALAACGGDDDAAEDAWSAATDAADTDADAGAAGGEQDAGFGGAGHWTAGQLCSLNDLMTMGALFPGIEVVERPGLDDPDQSVCSWDDAAIDRFDPASTLFQVGQRMHSGETFSESFERIDIPGADQAVFAEELYVDTLSGVLVAVGDRQLAVEFVKGAAGAREVAELVATTWVTMQSA